MEAAVSVPRKFIRLAAVKEMTSLGKTALYARIASGAFPRPCPLSGRAVGWELGEVQAWMRQRMDSRDRK